MQKRDTQADFRTRALCAELARLPSELPRRFRAIGPIARAAGLTDYEAEAAAIDATSKGWLLTMGEPPDSIALTDAGQKRVLNWLKGRRSKGNLVESR